jgi:pimeloyl-ACP methyl ester carboxylesterase
MVSRARRALPALAAAAVLLLAGCNSLFFYPSDRLFVPPEKKGIRYEDYNIPLADGTRFHGRHLLRKDSSAASKGLFILYHGNAQNLTSHWLQFAWVLSRGYDLFVFDYPGYGSSEGSPSRANSIESGMAALDFVSARLMPDSGASLVVVGESLGGAIMLRNLPDWKDRDRVTLAVAECTFPSYQGAARSALSKHWLSWSFQPLAYVLTTNTGAPKKHIRRIAPTPLLAATCLEDKVMDPAFTRQIHDRAGEPKWLWEIPGCGHIQVFRTRERQDRLLALVDSLQSAREVLYAP